MGRRELSTERGTEAPAKAARGAQREIGARVLARTVIRLQWVFVEDDRLGPDHVPDHAAEEGRRDAVGCSHRLARALGAPRIGLLGKPSPSCSDPCVIRSKPPANRLVEWPERSRGGGRAPPATRT